MNHSKKTLNLAEIPGLPKEFVVTGEIPTKERLEKILDEKSLPPDQLEAVRRLLESIKEQGYTSASGEEIGQQIKIIHEKSAAEEEASAELLTKALQGDADLIKAGEVGSPYKFMNLLIRKAKDSAEQSRN